MKLTGTDLIQRAVQRFQTNGHQQQLIVICSDVPVIGAILIKFIF